MVPTPNHGASKSAAARPVQKLAAIALRDSDWKLFFSDSDQYEQFDLFNEDVISIIQEKILRTTTTKVVSLTLSAASAAAFVISLYYLFFGHQVIAYQDSSEILVRMFSRWLALSKTATGNAFVLSALISLLVALLAQLSLAAEFWRENKQFERLIADLRVETKNAKQIYPGSGTLQFSYGSDGICVHSNTIDLTIGWHAVSDNRILMEKKEIGRGRRRSFVYRDSGDNADAATHLMVFLESANTSRRRGDSEDGRIVAREYLVIPRRFFASNQNASDWRKFVENMSVAKQNYDKRKSSALFDPTHAVPAATPAPGDVKARALSAQYRA